MAATAQDIETRARGADLLGDPNDGTQLIGQPAFIGAVNRMVAMLADALILQPAWVSNALALVAGTDAYTLADSTLEYGEVIDLRYANSTLGLPYDLHKVDPDRMKELRDVTTIPTQRPRFFILEPTGTQTVSVTFDTKPATAEYVDARVSLMPRPWADGDETPPTIPFSRRAIEALVLKVAAEIGSRMNDEVLTALKLNPAVFGRWDREAEELLRKERLDISRLKLQHGDTNAKWVLAWRKGD